MSESDSSTRSGSIWQRKDGRWGVQWSAHNPDTGAIVKHCTTRATREAAEGVLLNRPDSKDVRMDWSGPLRHRSDWGYGHLMYLKNSEDYCVYFVQAVEGGSIKIGSTKLLRTRMLALQSGCPIKLRVLHAIEGAGYREETALHRRFAKARLHGEWFRPVPELPGRRPSCGRWCESLRNSAACSSLRRRRATGSPTGWSGSGTG